MHTSRILVPTDLDDRSHTTLCYARELATKLRAELHILHVVPDAARESWAIDAAGVDLAAITSEWLRDADVRVQMLAHQYRFGPVAMFAVVRLGAVAEQVLAYAAEHRVDAIVIGLSKHGAVTRALRGSTVDRIVRRASCPVVTVPTATPRELEVAS